MRILAAIAAFACVSAAMCAQQAPQVMGTVATQDALVTGGLEVQGAQARLISNASVTAYDRTAAIALDRGGQVLVCATSEFHLLHSGTGKSLLFGLDRGAIELHSPIPRRRTSSSRPTCASPSRPAAATTCACASRAAAIPASRTPAPARPCSCSTKPSPRRPIA